MINYIPKLFKSKLVDDPNPNSCSSIYILHLTLEDKGLGPGFLITKITFIFCQITHCIKKYEESYIHTSFQNVSPSNLWPVCMNCFVPLGWLLSQSPSILLSLPKE